jgi:hypothetical protein
VSAGNDITMYACNAVRPGETVHRQSAEREHRREVSHRSKDVEDTSTKLGRLARTETEREARGWLTTAERDDEEADGCAVARIAREGLSVIVVRAAQLMVKDASF